MPAPMLTDADATDAFGLLPLVEDRRRFQQLWQLLTRRLGGPASPKVPRAQVPDGSTSQWQAWALQRTAVWVDECARGGVQLVPTDVRRVLFCGDWHGNLAWAVRSLSAAAASGADVVVQLGDFGMWPGRSGQHYLDGVSLAAEHLDLHVVFVDGNHEDFAQLYAFPLADSGWRPVRPRVVHAPRGHTWDWSGVRLGALGGATSIDRGRRQAGVSWWPQEAIQQEDLERLPAAVTGGPHVDMLLTHDAPSGVAFPDDAQIRSRLPQQELARADQHRRWIDAAIVRTTASRLMHGHFHVRHLDRVKVDGLECTTLGLDCDGVSDLSRSAVLSDLHALRSGKA